MVTRKSDRPLEVVTLRLYEGDRERMRDLYPSLGYNRAIREIIHKHLRQAESTITERAGEIAPELGSDLDAELAAMKAQQEFSDD